MKAWLLGLFVSLVAWGLGWLDAVVIWSVFDALFGQFTLTWTLLFVLAAAQQPFWNQGLRKELDLE